MTIHPKSMTIKVLAYTGDTLLFFSHNLIITEYTSEYPTIEKVIMKLTKTQADFVMYWVEWAKEESISWKHEDDKLWKQILKCYQKEAN